MFDNRIATLKQNTQGKFYCASVLKDSRVRTRIPEDGGSKFSVESELVESKFEDSNQRRLSKKFPMGASKGFSIVKLKSAIGNDESVARELILRSSY